MSERPILFSGGMVRAILAGTKTQTRRLLRQKWCLWVNNPRRTEYSGVWEFDCTPPLISQSLRVRCPYGQRGDRLWVRECWRELGSGQRPADGKIPKESVPVVYAADKGQQGPWRPSIHMPRWASRLTLEVTGVRVERLQDISEADAQAEGTQMPDGIPKPLSIAEGAAFDWSYKQEFAYLWDSINGKRVPWASNPWVWVVEFTPTPGACAPCPPGERGASNGRHAQEAGDGREELLRKAGGGSGGTAGCGRCADAARAGPGGCACGCPEGHRGPEPVAGAGGGTGERAGPGCRGADKTPDHRRNWRRLPVRVSV